MQRFSIGISAFLLATAASAQDVGTAKTNFVDAEGEIVGTAEISDAASGGVLIRIDISGLPEQTWVAFHVHETGTCDHETDHESAGGHFNPDSKDHGYWAANGPHAGDMPNQFVNAEGNLRAEVYNHALTLTESDNGIRGRALMIHAKGDDYRSQPSGDAGDRLACAVVQ